jgi:ABC-type Fe3+-hydroxamate transport system substrate-binding protein
MSAAVRLTDAAGREWRFDAPPRRVVSLVPSLTQTLVALGLADRLAGRTVFCSQPPELAATVPTVGGTKDPDVERVLALAPDLVLMDMEENRAEHAARLLERSVRVWAVLPTSLDDVARLFLDLGAMFAIPGPAGEQAGLLAACRERASRSWQVPVPVLCPVWRQPYMSFNRNTYIAALLRESGFQNILDEAPERYFRFDTSVVPGGPDLRVLLPTEPYPFDESMIPGLAADFRVPAGHVYLVRGELLSWYGGFTAPALATLMDLRQFIQESATDP